MNIRFTWDEAKRIQHNSDHLFYFVDAQEVFEGITITYEDDRFDYGEQRFVTLGLLKTIPVSNRAHRNRSEYHLIPFRKSTRRETKILYEGIKDRLETRSADEGPAVRINEDHPEADPRHIVRKIVRKGLQPIQPKASISLRIDADVLEWFKSQGAGYQTRINAVLRAFKEASSAQ